MQDPTASKQVDGPFDAHEVVVKDLDTGYTITNDLADFPIEVRMGTLNHLMQIRLESWMIFFDFIRIFEDFDIDSYQWGQIRSARMVFPLR